MNTLTDNPLELRRWLAGDPHRPTYHFLAPANWMNDPNGLIQWQGRYHLFYQHNPTGAYWDAMHWGHAVSEDLVHWEDLPVALAPTPGGPDAMGCWSGCMVDDNGVPTMIYTASSHNSMISGHTACLATGSDDLLEWRKYPGNPIIKPPPGDLKLNGFRDHCVWREDDTWYHLIGAGIEEVGGTVLLYRSHDLRQWEYMHPILTGDVGQTEPLWTGAVWECPQLIPLGDKHALIISVYQAARGYYTAYFIGEYRDHHFHPEGLHKLDYGDNHFYAPQAMQDDKGRWLMWGWMMEGRSIAAHRAAGWAGVMSLPREVTLAEDNTIALCPVPEIEKLRETPVTFADIHLDAGEMQMLEKVEGRALDIVARFEASPDTRCGILVGRSPDGEEETRIFVDRARGQLGIDRRQSTISTDEDILHDIMEGPIKLSGGEPFELRVLLDHSALEVVLNGRLLLSSRIYPEREDSTGIGLFSESGAAKVLEMSVFPMQAI